ncbi:hypothetical protein [Agrobacterium tumefaciens]|nr:hypothetical protein [Agrobacterium tumefaciens]UXT00398.1 hypothetical protein FY143_26800 [Agrobacterium tumefaciens]
MFGAIGPKLGKAAAFVIQWCNTYAMTQHLAEIAGDERGRKPLALHA